MINSVRKEILDLLEQLSELTPDVRFGQLIANLSYLAVGPTVEAIWDMEDEQLLDTIRQHISDLSRRGDFEKSLSAVSNVPPPENDLD